MSNELLKPSESVTFVAKAEYPSIACAIVKENHEVARAIVRVWVYGSHKIGMNQLEGAGCTQRAKVKRSMRELPKLTCFALCASLPDFL